MSAINLKSITGITSITTPAGVDNQLTLHNNNTTEAVKLDIAGNLHINNQLAVVGVSTLGSGASGQVRLDYQGNQRLKTHTWGVEVSNALSANNIVATAANSSFAGASFTGAIDANGDLDVDGHTNLDNVSIAGVTTVTDRLIFDNGTNAARDLEWQPSNNRLAFFDLVKATFGNTVDLQIYHNSTENHIYGSTNKPIIFSTNTDERLRIASDGVATLKNKLIIDDGSNGHLFLNNTSSDNTIHSGTTGFAAYKNLVINAAQHIFKVSNSEKLRIDSNGKFCFGTYNSNFASNDGIVSIVNAASAGTENPLLTLWNPTTVADSRAGIDFLTNAQYGTGRDGGFIRGSNDGVTAKANLQFGTIKDETYDTNFEIKSTGAVVISCDTGNTALTLTPTASASTSMIFNTWQDNSQGRNWAIRNRYHDHGRFEFMRSTANNNDPTTAVMSMYHNSNIGAPTGNNIYNASDERLKENMVELTDGLSKINQIKPYSFTWKSGFDKDLEGVTQYGFGAHQTKSVDEILVEPFGVGDVELNGETIENPLRVNEKHIIPLLVKAIQELSTKNDELEARIKTLESS